MILASRNCRSEDVRVSAIVVAELKFRNVERHVFAADLVERADNAALEDRPKAFDAIRVYEAVDVFAKRVLDIGVWVFWPQALIGMIVVGREQTDFVRN